MQVTAVICIVLEVSRYCDRTENTYKISGHVIIVAYIREPIISHEWVFSAEERRVRETEKELRKKSALASISMTVM